ncbi:Peptidyl-prolyl cis-trans isomerase PpiD [Rubellimicrobium mesophilum DSM 19309]|uniref:Parvulin-like PPIase n=1 Tax=Rubellimicrobium mesophilum DSM 19309 TaxID=442562 RepID=A0A017HFD1_9RHOB|nr:peptidylprolyl isomerase [Rubellimicrobium mesophilum]EYD72878.1 Peptidyl-prolyl cis-trans isomerase PpiD [Rubellimicrobium mesophilum DSM 19309]
MSDRPVIPRLVPDRAPALPGMMSACQSGGCGGAPAPRLPPPPDFGEVRVNGVEITPEAIAQEIQHHPAPDPSTAWREAARALAIRELLLQEAARLGLSAEPGPDEAGRLETDDDAVIAALLDHEVMPEEPSEQECRRIYESQASRFRTPDLFEASHILLEPEGDTEEAWDAAEAQARFLALRLGDDPAAFAQAARELSACPSKLQDGSLGQVRRGELVPAVQQAIEALRPGETGREPVRSRFGWHVIRLGQRIDGRVLPFEAVREKIAEMLGARSWSIGATRYVAALAGRSEIDGIAIEPADDARFA